MPLPKRRHSSTRRDKRRNSTYLKNIVFHNDNGSVCRPHKAHWDKNNLLYKREIIYSKSIKN